jgi:hypothetical protein
VAAGVLAAALLGGCASVGGIGGGEIRSVAGEPVPLLISWTSQDGGLSGDMVATLPRASYEGRFFEVTGPMPRESLLPLWNGWPVGWDDWPRLGGPPTDVVDVDAFLTRYSGLMVANLQDTRGGRMRCRLQLKAPTRGLAGGGHGECQLHGRPPVAVSF